MIENMATAKRPKTRGDRANPLQKRLKKQREAVYRQAISEAAERVFAKKGSDQLPDARDRCGSGHLAGHPVRSDRRQGIPLRRNPQDPDARVPRLHPERPGYPRGDPREPSRGSQERRGVLPRPARFPAHVLSRRLWLGVPFPPRPAGATCGTRGSRSPGSSSPAGSPRGSTSTRIRTCWRARCSRSSRWSSPIGSSRHADRTRSDPRASRRPVHPGLLQSALDGGRAYARESIDMESYPTWNPRFSERIAFPSGRPPSPSSPRAGGRLAAAAQPDAALRNRRRARATAIGWPRS